MEYFKLFFVFLIHLVKVTYLIKEMNTADVDVGLLYND